MINMTQDTQKMPDTKKRIITSAWDLFYKQGYENTTVDEIIEFSNTSKGTFYHYFKAKDALLNTLSDVFDQKYIELYPHDNPHMSACDKLLFLNNELFSLIDNQIEINLISYLYSSQLVTRDERCLLSEDRFYFKWLKEIIQKGIDGGEFSDKNTCEEYMNLYASFERAMIYDWCLRKGTYSLAKYSQKVLPHILDIFKTGI